MQNGLQRRPAPPSAGWRWFASAHSGCTVPMRARCLQMSMAEQLPTSSAPLAWRCDHDSFSLGCKNGCVRSPWWGESVSLSAVQHRHSSESVDSVSSNLTSSSLNLSTLESFARWKQHREVRSYLDWILIQNRSMVDPCNSLNLDSESFLNLDSESFLMQLRSDLILLIVVAQFSQKKEGAAT